MTRTQNRATGTAATIILALCGQVTAALVTWTWTINQ
jgi:hypothetical protein